MTRLSTAMDKPLVVGRKTEKGEPVVVLENATLHSFKLMSTGTGFEVILTIPLTEAEKLPALTKSFQKAVDIHIIRYSRRNRLDAAEK